MSLNVLLVACNYFCCQHVKIFFSASRKCMYMCLRERERERERERAHDFKGIKEEKEKGPTD